ncbi:hypothetical protein [Polyangium jinanense]|uniref:Uncharacterized protein n=1 Tax=Polyangium jinanense TaxID=2829994 RepID=A0A9X3XDM7_9BACT|nr:hypothetical protein [Polyangium jinanense]MDC3960494.1 hypothetical protein [Polyangium jinanense]MDC3986733.1 hypothetical protein [Polyangium jinanense]
MQDLVANPSGGQQAKDDCFANFSDSALLGANSTCPNVICDPKVPPAPANVLGKCSYYVWRYADFIRRHRGCKHTPPDYYMNYGFKYCTTFSLEVRPKLSPAGQIWLDNARMLLQVYMEKGLASNPAIERDNDKFKTFAFKTHPDAYWNAGFHDISLKDKLTVVQTPAFKEWLDKETWQQAYDMAMKEAKQYTRDAVDAARQKGEEAVDAAKQKGEEAIDAAIDAALRAAKNAATDKLNEVIDGFLNDIPVPHF